MWHTSDLAVLTRIIEIAPLFLSVPVAYLMFRVYAQTRRATNFETALPFLIFGVVISTACLTQSAWLMTMLGVHSGPALAVFSFGRVLRSIGFMIGCIAMERVWTNVVLKAK